MKRSDHPVYKKLKKRSDFFCPAKWNELYLYLNHGLSNSCHHPIPHSIPLDLAKKNPSVLHNTPHKLEQQEKMVKGIRPTECHMCWHIEDSDENAISDRILKSVDSQDDIEKLIPDPTYIPKFIEVVFDNTCNLSCSYCDGGQSSTWANRIRKNPLHLDTDHRQLYSNVPIKPGSTISEYNDIWLKWFPQIKDRLETIKLSGGEPLLSQNCWKFIESIDDASNVALSVNSNMSVKTSLVKRLLDNSNKFKSLSVSASVDATGKMAEYARQGLDYDLFLKNCHYYLQQGKKNTLKLQGTINVLNIFNFTELFDLRIELREQYNDQIADLYVTVVRHPEFQSINILPDNIRNVLILEFEEWHRAKCQLLSDKENVYFNKILSYIKTKPKSLKNHNVDMLKKDFYNFLQYYDKNSKDSYKKIYPDSFVKWVESLK